MSVCGVFINCWDKRAPADSHIRARLSGVSAFPNYSLPLIAGIALGLALLQRARTSINWTGYRANALALNV